MTTTHRNGLLFLGFGVFFPLVFLIGGGVVTSSNGTYSTALFGVAYLLGIMIPGPWVYLSAKATGSATPPPTPSITARLIGPLALVLTSPLCLLFFRSELFLNNLAQHAFLLSMGFCLAQFIPLGLGFLHAEGHREPRQG